MLRMAWISLAIAVATGTFGFGVTAGLPIAPLQLAAFLFALLFLIFLILGSSTLRNFI